MSTYNDASLIYYPSGYKAGTAYSLKPTDGSGDLTFTRASTATRVNESGLIESVATGVPRIDFTGGGCAKLLLEPQRTNLQTQSNGFLSNWNNNEVTTSVGESTLISGGTTTLMTETAINAVHRVVSVLTVSLTIGSVYTISFYAKSNGTRNIGLRTGFTGSSANIIFNPNTQTAVSVPAGFTTNITAANDGYYRYSITATAGVASDLISVVMFDGTSLVYTGTTQSIYISAIQTELGSYATSYIPTTSTAVTRVVDKSSTTGLNSIIGQTEGTIYLEGIAANINADLLGINRSTTNAIFITKSNLNAFRVYVYAGGVGLTFTDPNVNTDFYKLAITYKSGNSYLYVNGVKIGATNTSTFTFSAPLNILELAGNYFVGVNEQKIQGLMIFQTAKSEAEVAALTTL